MLLRLYKSAHSAMTVAHGDQYAPSSQVIQLGQERLNQPQSTRSPDILMHPQSTLILPSELIVPSEGLHTPASTSPTPSITVMSPPPETPLPTSHSSPFLVSQMVERRSEEHEPGRYILSDYVRMHTFQNQGGNQLILPNLAAPAYNTGIPYSSSLISPYGSEMESGFTSPYLGGPLTAIHSSSGAMQLSHHETENISWEQFMSSMGL